MIDQIIGKTIFHIEKIGVENEIVFHCTDGTSYKMYHSQDCCESVYLEDINGDLNDLIGTPIVTAYESTSRELSELEKLRQVEAALDGDEEYDSDRSFTWTFYRLSTMKGTVVLRWYGTSNGYYSETATVEEVPSPESMKKLLEDYLVRSHKLSIYQ